MKWFFLVSCLWMSAAQAQSAEFPIPRIKGLYTYQGHYNIPNVRRAETVSIISSQGQMRLKELRADGYSCIHKDPDTRLCFKNWTPSSNPPGFDAAVEKAMAPIQVEFEGGSTPPQLVQDGSTSQEWDVSEKVKVIQSEVSMYRVSRDHEGIVHIAFPVSENQPLSPLRFRDERALGVTMVAQEKDTPVSTVAYTIEAFIEKNENSKE